MIRIFTKSHIKRFAGCLEDMHNKLVLAEYAANHHPSTLAEANTYLQKLLTDVNGAIGGLSILHLDLMGKRPDTPKLREEPLWVDIDGDHFAFDLSLVKLKNAKPDGSSFETKLDHRDGVWWFLSISGEWAPFGEGESIVAAVKLQKKIDEAWEEIYP